MHLEDLKRWHWALIGIVVGAVFALAYLAVKTPDVGLEGTLKQSVFERELPLTASTEADIKGQRFAIDGDRGGPFAPAPAGGRALPRLRNLTVYPAGGGRMLVTGERLVEILPQRLDPDNPDRILPAAAHYTSFFCRTDPGPYKPRFNYDGEPAPNLTLLDYLRHVEEKHPDAGLTYRYAWWTIKPLAIAIGALSGLILIGGVWPTVVGLLIGAGFGHPPAKEPDYDLDRFNHAPEPAKPATAAAVDPAALAAHLERLEGGLLADLRQSDAARREEPEEAAPAVKDLKTAPLEAPAGAAESAKENVEFTGEFYPVAHKVTKKND